MLWYIYTQYSVSESSPVMDSRVASCRPAFWKSKNIVRALKFGSPRERTQSLKGSDHCVLFQNADDTINMGVIFNDPDVELSDIYWYVVLADLIDAVPANANLVTFDRKLKTKSCYVELHRIGALNDS